MAAIYVKYTVAAHSSSLSGLTDSREDEPRREHVVSLVLLWTVSWTQFALYMNFFRVIDYPRIPQLSEKIKESASCLIWHMFEFLKLLYLTENKFCWLINERPYCFSDVDNKFYSSIPLREMYSRCLVLILIILESRNVVVARCYLLLLVIHTDFQIKIFLSTWRRVTTASLD